MSIVYFTIFLHKPLQSGMASLNRPHLVVLGTHDLRAIIALVKLKA